VRRRHEHVHERGKPDRGIPAQAKRHDVEVKHAMIGDILTYKGRENMVVVWMTKIDPTFGMPAVQGLPFMIGSRQAKEELVEQIMKKLDEIYVP
jgi:hypothetical protein